MRFRTHLLIGFATLLLVAGLIYVMKLRRHQPFLPTESPVVEIDLFGKKYVLSGLWPDIDLPPEATPEQIVAKVAELRPDMATLFIRSRVLATRTMTNPSLSLNGYTITLVESPKGTRTFVVYRYDPVAEAWIVREFNREGKWPVADE